VERQAKQPAVRLDLRIIIVDQEAIWQAAFLRSSRQKLGNIMIRQISLCAFHQLGKKIEVECIVLL
jgi:hypothetical protein